MLTAARFAADEALLDKVLFRVDAKTYDGLMAYLDEPPFRRRWASQIDADHTAVAGLTPTAPLAAPEALREDHDTDGFDSGEPTPDICLEPD